jgi:hypothetical protein
MIIPPKRTQRDLFLHIIKRIGGPEAGAPLLEAFNPEAFPRLPLNNEHQPEITEEEFLRHVRQIEKELPAFLHWLRSTDFPDPSTPPVPHHTRRKRASGR